MWMNSRVADSSEKAAGAQGGDRERKTEESSARLRGNVHAVNETGRGRDDRVKQKRSMKR